MASKRAKAQPVEDAGLSQMRKRYRLASEAWQEAYDKALDDVKFVTVPGHQWDEHLRARRKNRAMYEFPKLRMMIQQIINEQKQSRPQGKVRGVEEGDRGLAEIMQGLCRNIESTSNAEQAYDIGFEFAVRGGMGWWRITTDYANQDDFDLDIRIKPVRNPFAVKPDPSAVEIDRRDMGFLFYEDLIPKDEFEARYPDADITDFFESPAYIDFCERGQVKVCEYWYRKPATKELWRLSNGAVLFGNDSPLSEEELLSVGVQVVGRRMVEAHTVYMRLTNGKQWLTEEVTFPCKYIPFVPTWGNIDNIEGVDYFSGAVRFAKDQQRLHNLHRTLTIEAVAKAPKAPFILKPSWITGYESFWKNANSEDYPYLPITETGQVPQRAEQAEVPAALITLANLDNDDMRAQTGQYAANLGAPSNEASGRAIGLRRQQGATATFNYIDNLTYAIQFTYEILVDMIPRVYDTPRVVRVLGEDGGAKWKQLYQEVVDPQTGQPVVLNDISKGKYDVTVTVGPSYATQRMEAVEAFSQLGAQLGQSAPGLAPLITYQVVKNLDLPGSEEVDTALRKGLVAQGLLPPKDGEAPPEPPPPDPRMEAQVRKLQAGAAKDEATAAKTAAEAQLVLPQGQVDLQASIAELVRLEVENAMARRVIASAPMPAMPGAGMPPLSPTGF